MRRTPRAVRRYQLCWLCWAASGKMRAIIPSSVLRGCSIFQALRSAGLCSTKSEMPPVCAPGPGPAAWYSKELSVGNRTSWASLPVSKKLWLNLALSFQKPVNFLETHCPASQFPRNWTKIQR